MNVTWGSAAGTTVKDDDIGYGLRPSASGEWQVVVEFSTEDFGGMLLEDADGSALVWNDFVANEWVELFSMTSVALMRLALLLDASEREAWFVNDALGFHKFAIEFMHESAPNPMPRG